MAVSNTWDRDSFRRSPPIAGAALQSTTAGEGASLIGCAAEAGSVEDAVVSLRARALALEAGSVQKRTVTVGHADLTGAVNGAAQAINIGAVLPANARVVGVDFSAETAFSGGGASAVTADIGTAGDVDALIDGADLFAAVVDGGPPTIPKGIRPNKTFVAAGAQLIATFAPDGAHTLLALDAGSVVIDVLFVVLA